MEEHFIISESEIEKLLEEAKAEALEMVKAELKTAIAEIIRKKVESFHQPFLLKEKQQIPDVSMPFEEAMPVEEKKLEEEVPSQKTDSIPKSAPPYPPIDGGERGGRMEETLKEIERIKSQIARNEELLQQAKTQKRESEKVGQSLVTSDSRFPTSDLRGDGLYVYCITNEIDGDIGEEIDVKGIDGQNPVFSLSYIPPLGGGNQGLSAIVSRVPLAEFNEAEITQKAASGDLSWFEDKSRHHELVIRSVMEKNTVIPMKFCTIYTSEENVLQFLEEHKNELREHLDYFAGKSEWGVKVYCNLGRLAEEKNKRQSNSPREIRNIMQSNHILNPISRGEEMKPKSPGVAYFAKRKRDIVMEKELRQLMHDMSQEIYDRLAKFAVESRQNELLDSKATGKGEPMILNAAYSIKQSGLEAFNNELAKIQEEQNPFGYELVVSGPWPPYNFVKSLGEMNKRNEDLRRKIEDC
jgi:hypothetical protein